MHVKLAKKNFFNFSETSHLHAYIEEGVNNWIASKEDQGYEFHQITDAYDSSGEITYYSITMIKYEE